MAWTIEFDRFARKELKKLDGSIRRQILEYLENRVAPAENPTQLGKALTSEFAGLWRYRVGDFRILCRLEHEAAIVFVLYVGHRSAIYDTPIRH